jgi:uncharacterized protein YdiU (UPF0061 family)
VQALCDEAMKLAEAALAGYPERFGGQYAAHFRAKFGLPPEAPVAIIQECLGLLDGQGVDFTLFFRHLTRVAGGEDPKTLAVMFSSSEPFRLGYGRLARVRKSYYTCAGLRPGPSRIELGHLLAT